MADSDTSQQGTSKTPAAKQKDPKKVAAGKALQEKIERLVKSKEKYSRFRKRP